MPPVGPMRLDFAVLVGKFRGNESRPPEHIGGMRRRAEGHASAWLELPESKCHTGQSRSKRRKRWISGSSPCSVASAGM